MATVIAVNSVDLVIDVVYIVVWCFDFGVLLCCVDVALLVW